MGLICTTEEDVLRELRKMRYLEEKSRKIEMDRLLYAKMKKNDFGRFHELEAQAGIYSTSLAYSDYSFFIEVRDGKSVQPCKLLKTLSETVGFLWERVLAGDRTIELLLDPVLFSKWKNSSATNGHKNRFWLSDLTDQVGILHYSYSYKTDKVLGLSIEKLYPGTAIVVAKKKGSLNTLSVREKQTLTEAEKIAAICKGSSAYDTALKIHDYLGKTIVYTIDDSKDDDDTAVGAILDRKANCDGFSDAFFLIGTLAGLQVGYMVGFSRGKDPDRDAAHMWNILKLNGSWRMVDVTWDGDRNDTLYCWFNVGHDRAVRRHVWNEEMYEPLAPKTDLSTRPKNEFTVSTLADVNAAVNEAAKNKYKTFTLIFDDKTHISLYKDKILEKVSHTIPSSCIYSSDRDGAMYLHFSF